MLTTSTISEVLVNFQWVGNTSSKCEEIQRHKKHRQSMHVRHPCDRVGRDYLLELP